MICSRRYMCRQYVHTEKDRNNKYLQDIYAFQKREPRVKEKGLVGTLIEIENPPEKIVISIE